MKTTRLPRIFRRVWRDRHVSALKGRSVPANTRAERRVQVLRGYRALSVADIAAEAAEIDAVEVGAAGVDALGRFEDAWDGGKAGIVEKIDEAGAADEALADVFVAVDAAAAFAFGVVDVDAADAVYADLGGQLPHHALIRFGVAEIMAGGEEVAGVKADGETFGRADGVEDAGEVPELVAEHGALAGRALEGYAHGEAGGGGVDVVEGGGDAGEADVDAVAEVRAGVEDKVRNAERFAAG